MGKKLEDRDREVLWHPLTQHQNHPNAHGIVRAESCTLYDTSGHAYIDGIASWYTAMYGHCHPDIVAAVSDQLNTLDQIVFSGFTHPPAVELAEALLNILPANQQKIFYSDNGSTATEVAIKMALQFYFNKGQRKTTLIAFEDAFHGDTFGAMSVSGLSVYNGPFEGLMLDVKRIPLPIGDNNLEVLRKFESILSSNEVAAFIYEPLVQGAAGMKIYDKEGLSTLLKICAEKKVLTIADEVMTGFGKTGTHFASDQLPTKPDIICLSKALSAGALPLAATSCTAEIFNAFLGKESAKGFFHGHTYTANPPACSAALAGIRLLLSSKVQNRINEISEHHRIFCHKLGALPNAKNPRCLGVILAFELNIPMTRYGNLRDQLFDFFMQKGVFIRPLGNTIYILPPYVISDDELQTLYNALLECIDQFMPTS